MIYREFAPGPRLRPYIECFWSARSQGRLPFLPREVLIPDGTTELMLNFGSPYRRFRDAHDRAGRAIARSHVIGIRETGVFIEQERDQDVFGIRFRIAGFHAFAGVPMREIAHRTIDLDGLLGPLAAELEARVQEAASPEAAVNSVEAALLPWFGAADRRLRQVRAAVGEIYTSRGSADIAAVADRVSLSHKELDRAFDRIVGLTPKRLARVVRFNHALRLMLSDAMAGQAAVAQEAGYFDEAHMIRDFREFTSQTPRDFARQRYAIVAAVIPALDDRLSNSYNR